MAVTPRTRTRHRARGAVGVVLVAAAAVAVLASAGGAQEAGDGAGEVHVVDISGTIDLGLAPYLERVLGDAEDAGADAVLVEIDTPGGRVDAVLQMRDALLRSPMRTIAFVNSTALSAGALVALASEEIHLTPSGVMGAATPVVGGTGEVADEKTVSAIRSVFEATAEQRGRDPRIAAAMVDPDLAVDDVSPAGDLLTLTASQALEVGYAESLSPDRETLLAELGFGDHTLVSTSPSLAERLVRLVTSPVVASLLLLVGILVIVGDLASGGAGVGVAAGAGLLALFFWGHMLAGLAGWEDVALVILGLALVAVEIFVVPGVGVAGFLGFAGLAAGAFLAMVNRDFDFVSYDDLWRAGTTVAVALAGAIAGTVAVLVWLNRSGTRHPLVLSARVGSGEPITARADFGWLRWFGGTGTGEPVATRDAAPVADAPGEPTAPGGGEHRPPTLVGAHGTAITDLHPAGMADIDGDRVDVVTSGEYVRRGEPVEVVRDDGYRRVVRSRRPRSDTVTSGDQ